MKLRSKTGILLVGIAFAGGFLAAQDYRIDWSSVDGGGGTSTGGNYVLSGTIGQPDATPVVLTGGSYRLQGGFWTGWILPGDSELPELRIAYGAGGLMLTWPESATGFTLEQADHLPSDEWTASPAQNGVPIPASDRAVFYRLRKG
jgi:hypothetical protein